MLPVFAKCRQQERDKKERQEIEKAEARASNTETNMERPQIYQQSEG